MKCGKIIILISVFFSLVLKAPEHTEIVKQELNKDYENYKETQRFNYLMTAEFSRKNLKELLNTLNLPDPETIYIQFIIETGHFKSNLFKNHNNICGMHKAYKRKTTASYYVVADGGAKVSGFESWQSSVLDFVLYINYWESKGYDTTDYKQFLVDVKYCELGGGYINLINQFEKFT